MALEDLTGVKYVSDLNEAWPLGTDTPDAGDDHIRGIKNVLKRTFPNLTGPVTRTQGDLNLGSVPSGSIMVFLQEAAPLGWTRLPGLADTSMLRIVKSTDPGGILGGTDDPVLNDKVVSHVHTYTGTSGNDSPGHVHVVSGSTNTVGDHVHGIPAAATTAAAGVGATVSGVGPTTTMPAGVHAHTFSVTSGAATTNHKHTFAGTTAAPADTATWTPRYIDSIVCVKD